MQGYVFLSHAATDRAVAEQVCHALESDGVPCWIAPRDVPPGASYGAALVRAIKGARAMVLVLSPRSNVSQQVVREVERAASTGIAIIPLCIEPVRLSEDMEFFISSRHILDATAGSLAGHLQRVREAIASLERERTRLEEHSPEDVRESAERAGGLSTIKALSPAFYSADRAGRRAAADAVARAAERMDLGSVLHICGSRDRAERVAGYIALGVHVASGVPEADRDAVLATLRAGVGDGASRVRYQAVKSVGMDLDLARRLTCELQMLGSDDPNDGVQALALLVLSRAARTDERR
jgi:hypothetical protein